MPPRIEVKQFYPDKEQISEIRNVIHTSWEHDYRTFGYLYYGLNYLQWLLEPHHEKSSVMTGAFDSDTDKLVGVNAALPRTICLNGVEHNSAISTFLSVLPKYRRSGIGGKLVKTAHEALREEDIHHNLGFFEPEYNGLKTYQSIKNLHLAPLFQGRWLAKVINPKEFAKGVDVDSVLKGYLGDKSGFGTDRKKVKGAPSKSIGFLGQLSGKLVTPSQSVRNIIGNVKKLKNYSNPTIKTILNDLNSHSKSLPLARCWSERELRWHLTCPISHNLIIRGKDDRIKGFVNYMIFKIKSVRVVKYAWLDNIYLEKTTPTESQALLFSATADAINEGCSAMIAPTLRYFKDSIVRTNGFLPYGRRFELWVSSFQPIDEWKATNKCYIDVR
ncbi:MAG: GNAT family N-acetyltransferase [Thermoplasmata archaeon]|nr:MAG: GNAT family N-acetyltransferase [Thermoplasmata archaeon]